MAKLTYKLSYYVLYGCIALIIVAFAVFFLIGYDNKEGDKNAPQLTNVRMFLMYSLIVGTALLTVWSGAKGVSNGGSVSKNMNGVPAKKISIGVIGVLVVSLALGFIANMGVEAYVSNSGNETSAGWVQVSEMFIWSIYILIIAAVIAVLANMAGFLKK